MFSCISRVFRRDSCWILYHYCCYYYFGISDHLAKHAIIPEIFVGDQYLGLSPFLLFLDNFCHFGIKQGEDIAIKVT